MRRISLCIAVPSNRDHKPAFVLHLMALHKHLLTSGIQGVEKFDLMVKFKSRCSNLPQSRQDFLDEARKEGVTHLLFLDDDMTFPATLVDSLWKHQLPVVAANCCHKDPMGLHYTAMGLDGLPIASKGQSGLCEVAQVGTAVMLIDLEAISHVEPPHFMVEWLPDRGRYCSEDVFFCYRLRQAGIRVHIDHDLSNQVGHVGDYTYCFASYQEAQEA